MADPMDLLKAAQGAIRDPLEPARAVMRVAEQATESMRAQAIAFRAASASLAEVADLLEQQVKLLDGLRDPASVLRAAGEAVTKGGAAKR